MPIYEDDRLSKEDLLDLRKKNRCKKCGGPLNVFLDEIEHKAFIACWDWLRTHHDEGIEREASRYEKKGIAALNINTRRERMTQDYGPETTKALDKYLGVVSLTKPQAKEILEAVFPEAPEEEISRAVILCASYGLNPLMKHVFLIPFNKGKPSESWATVIGIKAKRLLASRRGSYSYTDNTPRIMTEEEQRRTFGEINAGKICVLTKVKDPATGAEAPGYGTWPKDSEPYGTEKGNSKFNMAAIRSESQALDRLRPGEMPVGIEVMPEEAADSAIEGEFTVKEEPEPTREEVKKYMKERVEAKADSKPFYGREEPEPKPKEHWCEEHDCAFELKKSRFGSFYAHKAPDGSWCNEKKKRNTDQAEADASIKPSEVPMPELDFDRDWLLDSLKQVHWKDDTVKSYLKNVYKVDIEGTVVEVVARLNQGQMSEFFKEIQDRLDMQKPVEL